MYGRIGADSVCKINPMKGGRPSLEGKPRLDDKGSKLSKMKKRKRKGKEKLREFISLCKKRKQGTEGQYTPGIERGWGEHPTSISRDTKSESRKRTKGDLGGRELGLGEGPDNFEEEKGRRNLIVHLAIGGGGEEPHPRMWGGPKKGPKGSDKVGKRKTCSGEKQNVVGPHLPQKKKQNRRVLLTRNWENTAPRAILWPLGRKKLSRCLWSRNLPDAEVWIISWERK